MPRPARSSGQQPLGADYFTRYGVNTAGTPKRDYARSWRHFTFSLPEILRVWRANPRAAGPNRPRTFLDIGAADGRFVALALKAGLDAWGIENSPYILARIEDPGLRARIIAGDAADAVAALPAGSQDLILECAAQYLPPRRLGRYLRNVARLCAPGGMICLLVDPRNYQGDRAPAHTGARTFETMTWWRARMTALGLKRVPGHDFFFLKD
jgi:SAM-dependent methyltransferase